MNRKATREQNDISIIIGNLPKRLQDKIIIREGSNASTSASNSVGGAGNGTTNDIGVGGGSGGGSTSTRHQGCDEAAALEADVADLTTVRPHGSGDDSAVTSIDYFLRLAANDEDGSRKAREPVSEASGFTSNNAMAERQTPYAKATEGEQQDGIAIPGLIRLNAENAKKLNKTSNTNTAASRSYERRMRQHPIRQEVLAHATKNDMPMSPVRQIQHLNHPSWLGLLDDSKTKRLPTLLEAMQQIMSRGQVIESWSNLCLVRSELQDIFQHLLLTHLKMCCEQKIDSYFWKLLFYNMREHLKQYQNDKRAIKAISIIIEKGIEFYEHLVTKMQTNYLSAKEGSQSMPERSKQKMDFIAKVMTQKLLICLGDLWRYKIKDAQGVDYSEAEKYYQQAQALVPSNGVPYNQLAIVAILNRKKFGAIYFHMRSLMSSKAMFSSKESLLVLFDEIRKKYEETEQKASPIHLNAYNNYNAGHSSAMRKEVWIYPDGMRRLHRTELNGNSCYKMTFNEEKRFMDMPVEELLRRITSLYLYILGKLFTGIGMETITEHQRKLLLQLSVLLKHDRFIISRSRLLKMLALNIFVIEHNMNKDTRRYHAFNFCNQFFGLILRKTNDLLSQLNRNPDDFEDELFYDLDSVFQYNRIYVLFLKHHINIWEPIKSQEHIHINPWMELENLFELLKLENFTMLTTTTNQEITFEEDIFFAGFTPLVSVIPKIKTNAIIDESIRLKARMKVICDFQISYNENENRLKYQEPANFVNEDLHSDIKQALDNLQITQCAKSNGVISERQIRSADQGEHSNSLNGITAANDDDDEAEHDDDDDDLENNAENIVINGDCMDNRKSKKSSHWNDQLSHLSKLKKELEAKSNVKKMYHNKLEEILKFVDTKLYIEVRPKYLLPDTNCFIDCLEDFQHMISELKRYTIIVPLTVVKELDGLSKGIKVEPYQELMEQHRIHHYDDVSSRAKKSLEFIKNAKGHVKCATSKGSIINASLFGLMEEEYVSNDDKILATAMSLSKTMSSETSKDGKCFIQTELVLITTDRNLRVKALARNLAVSEWHEFLQWARDCN